MNIPKLPNPVDISKRKDGGILKRVIRESFYGEKPPPHSTTYIHYVGTLLDGTQFDASRERGPPFSFEVGKGTVIKGLDLGVQTMIPGEVALFTIAPEYAYGEAGSPPTVPPNAILNFEVELLSWAPEDISREKDKSLQRIRIIPGDGYSSPTEGALLDIEIEGYYDNKLFDKRNVQFAMGEGEQYGIIEGIETALEKFKRGEKSKLIIGPAFNRFHPHIHNNYGIPHDIQVTYMVTLKSFTKPKECWSMDNDEKLEYGKMFKTKGTQYFNAERYNLAIKMYKKAIEYLGFDKETDPKLSEERKTLLIALNLNIALCNLRIEEYVQAERAATQVLQLDPHNEKAHFRRGMANMHLHETRAAMRDFENVLRLEPSNKAAKNYLFDCQYTLKKERLQEKSTYANMFEKFARSDTQREEEKKKKEFDIMSSLGEWGKEDREREPSEFEKENPNILMLNGTGEFKDM